VRKALSAILRTGEWFGAGHLIDILTGNATPKVKEKGHDGLPTFGVGRESVQAGLGCGVSSDDGARSGPPRHRPLSARCG
jgi:ATP-dependent DNA helicase RecQ